MSLADEEGPDVSSGKIDALLDRWYNDAEFRAAMRADPAGTLARCGIDLSDEEREALLRLDPARRPTDAQLEERISK
jgi:hypothetical protein